MNDSNLERQILTTKWPSQEVDYWFATSKLREILFSKNIPIKSDPTGFFPTFASASIEEKSTFLHKINSCIDICAEATVEHINLLEDQRYIWTALRKLNLIPPHNLINMIEPKDHVEIYDSQGIQIFANFEFLKVVSYNLEEMYWHPWSKLYKREAKYTEQVMKAFIKSVTDATGPFNPEVEPHICEEAIEGHFRKAKVEMKMFSPLYSVNSKEICMLATSNISLI